METQALTKKGGLGLGAVCCFRIRYFPLKRFVPICLWKEKLLASQWPLRLFLSVTLLLLFPLYHYILLSSSLLPLPPLISITMWLHLLHWQPPQSHFISISYLCCPFVLLTPSLCWTQSCKSTPTTRHPLNSALNAFSASDTAATQVPSKRTRRWLLCLGLGKGLVTFG